MVVLIQATLSMAKIVLFSAFLILYSYTTLVLCKDSTDEMLYLSWILICFEAVSGLKVNLEKKCYFSCEQCGEYRDISEGIGV